MYAYPQNKPFSEKMGKRILQNNSTTLLSLFMNKKDFTHLINQHLNLHMLTFFKQINDFWVKILFFAQTNFLKFCRRNLLCVSTIGTQNSYV